LVVIFVVYEHWFAGVGPLLPLRFFKNPTQIGCCIMAFFIFFSFVVATYYLPLLFQAVKHHSAQQSGIDILPFLLGVTISSAISAGVVTYSGHYWPILVLFPLIISAGSALLYTLNETASNSKLIGYQIVFAVGVGGTIQNTLIALQANVARQADIPQATALVTFCQLIGGALGIAVGGTVFGNQLGKGLTEFAPDAPFDLVKNSVEAIYTLSPDLIPGVIHAYVRALDFTYIIGIPCGVFATAAAFLVARTNIKGRNMMEMAGA